MDHSIRGYLQRRTTEELQLLLEEYRNRESASLEQEYFLIVQDILQKRCALQEDALETVSL